MPPGEPSGPCTNVVVLGSTGSVGRSALDVIGHEGEGRLRAWGLGARSRRDALVDQATAYRPRGQAPASGAGMVGEARRRDRAAGRNQRGGRGSGRRAGEGGQGVEDGGGGGWSGWGAARGRGGVARQTRRTKKTTGCSPAIMA